MQQLTEDQRRIRFWRPDSPFVAGMFRVEREQSPKTTYSEHFSLVVIYEGAFEGWYRGELRTHVAGALELKEPGEVHRHVRVAAPVTLQGVALSHESVSEAASALGVRDTPHFKAAGFAAGERPTQLAFELHAALVRSDAPEIERATLVAETLAELLAVTPRANVGRAPRAVRLARAYLHDELAEKITLQALADHAGLDKFHLVRAFRASVGLPPYEYLTHVRVAKAKQLLEHGASVAAAARALGFYDESQLHRHFRRIVGVTPGRYARSFVSETRTRQHRPSQRLVPAGNSPHDPIPSY